MFRREWGAAGLLLSLIAAPALAQTGLAKIENIVVIYAENRSFDHLYGLFPGADGLANATPEQWQQRDHDGSVLPYLQVWGHDGKPDPKLPRLPNAPFRIDLPPVERRADKVLISPIHAYYHSIEQINAGRNDRFVAMSNVGAWVMGHFDGSGMKLWQWARDYTLADNFFMGAFGGSYLNHLWLVCACTPVFRDAPKTMRAELSADGKLLKKPESPSARDGAVQVHSGGSGQVTPDGFSVNTTQPRYQPSGIPPAPDASLEFADPKGTQSSGQPLPPQTARTIADTMSAKDVSWAWYAGGWNAALLDGQRPPGENRTVIYSRIHGSLNFQAHHQPFNYFRRFAPGTQDRLTHLRDAEDLFNDIETGTLPQVTFYKPAGVQTQHPSYTDLMTGDAHIADLLDRLTRSPQWPRMLVIVTYDENGGFWDHVPPPSGPGWGDRWGPGTRIPTLIVSPFAKRGFIDKTTYDTTSILKLITRRFDLEPLPGVREKMGDLTAPLNLD
jgi:acid phosphatase